MARRGADASVNGGKDDLFLTGISRFEFLDNLPLASHEDSVGKRQDFRQVGRKTTTAIPSSASC